MSQRGSRGTSAEGIGWKKSYGRYDVSSGEVEQTIVDEPLPETNVLLGYVKSAEHWRWIHKTKSYNVRTEERVGGVTSTTAVLYCQLLMLYCPELETIALARVVSSPERVDREAMKVTGYPNPTSDYWCIQLSWLAAPDSIAGLRAASISAVVERMGKRKGEPLQSIGQGSKRRLALRRCTVTIHNAAHR